MAEIEKDVEAYLKRKVTARGGLCMKFVSPGLSGVPDRIVVLDGQIVFVEMKKPGGRPRPLQVRIITLLRNQGCWVEVVDTKERAERLVEEIASRATRVSTLQR
ncbi:VRR-NUC domain-containing protein [Lapidilactobacillus bayanensis]|uniref:VRR-NUC domain-containing protein n=1 Tax=Lapidilactobacillus bayanensis TaxID=2485998 RepID=UPI000F7A7320|nr:VRR-NUC domain-containing protein [Lapidilactobacillus bayanensis]